MRQTSLLLPAADLNMKQPIKDLYLIAGRLVLATHRHALPMPGTVALVQRQGHTLAHRHTVRTHLENTHSLRHTNTLMQEFP